MHQNKNIFMFTKNWNSNEAMFIPEIQVQIQPIAPTELYTLISGIRRDHDIPFALGLPLKSFSPPPIVNFLQYR